MQKYVTLKGGSRFAPIRLFGYYAQRVITSRRLRRYAANAVIAGLKLRHPKHATMGYHASSFTDTMKKKGYLSLGRFLTSEQCADILGYLRNKEVIAQRGSKQRFTIDSVPQNTINADYPLETVVNAPYIVEIANHPDILGIAASYLGFTPTITLMSLRWSFPSENIDIDVQGFHRDVEIGSMKLLIYLTDVDAKTGPHHYVEGTHLERAPLRLRRYSDSDIQKKHGGSLIVTGPAGTAFAIDTKGIHKGAPPITRPRLLLSIQYSILPCLNYEYDPVRYRHDTNVNHYINRLMISFKNSEKRLETTSDNPVAFSE